MKLKVKCKYNNGMINDYLRLTPEVQSSVYAREEYTIKFNDWCSKERATQIVNNIKELI